MHNIYVPDDIVICSTWEKALIGRNFSAFMLRKLRRISRIRYKRKSNPIRSSTKGHTCLYTGKYAYGFEHLNMRVFLTVVHT